MDGMQREDEPVQSPPGSGLKQKIRAPSSAAQHALARAQRPQMYSVVMSAGYQPCQRGAALTTPWHRKADRPSL